MKRYRNKETGVILAPATPWVEAMYAENPLFEAVEETPAGKVAPDAGEAANEPDAESPSGEAIENKATVDQAAGDQTTGNQARKKK